MRYFLDTEFIEDGKTIDLLSIGIVAEDGSELYLENEEADHSKANPWVRENVLPFLVPAASVSREHIVEELVEFVDISRKPEFWGYYADYDWVVLCQLFGTMMDLPKGWPMFCMDLKQWAVMLGNPQLPKQTSVEHHALADAHWNMSVYKFLRAKEWELWG